MDGLTSRIKSVFGHMYEINIRHMQSGSFESISNVVVDEFVLSLMLSCGLNEFVMIKRDV